jgi:hypothetical protein
MPSINAISVDKLMRLIGTPHCSALVDVRRADEFESDPCLIPGSMRRPCSDPSSWAGEYLGRSAIVICQTGGQVSEGAAAGE